MIDLHFVIWLLLGVLVGYVAHELAHAVVLVLAGEVRVTNVRLSGVQFDAPTPIPWSVRVAAVAPALVGVGLFLAVLFLGATVNWLYLTAGISARCVMLSKADRQLARGIVSG